MKQSSTSSTAPLLFFALIVLTASVAIEARRAIPGNKNSTKSLPNEAGDQSRYTLSRSGSNSAILTVNDFSRHGGSGAAECDGKFHSDNTPVVALSTRWYENGARCHKKITIFGNGRTTEAMVVDECDTPHDHCGSNIVDGSKAVWKALGVNKGNNKFGEMRVTWSDA